MVRQALMRDAQAMVPRDTLTKGISTGRSHPTGQSRPTRPRVPWGRTPLLAVCLTQGTVPARSQLAGSG